MNISTERLRLTQLGPQYLLSTHEYASDLENTKYMVHLPNADINQTKGFLDRVHKEWQKENPTFYEFAILLDDKHIGAVSIYLDQVNGIGELGWIINKKYWGNGYATEAATGVMNFAIQDLKLKKIIAQCDSENTSSFKVMSKLGLSLVEKTKGRKNRSSSEEREELLYSLEI